MPGGRAGRPDVQDQSGAEDNRAGVERDGQLRRSGRHREHQHHGRLSLAVLPCLAYTCCVPCYVLCCAVYAIHALPVSILLPYAVPSARSTTTTGSQPTTTSPSRASTSRTTSWRSATAGKPSTCSSTKVRLPPKPARQPSLSTAGGPAFQPAVKREVSLCRGRQRAEVRQDLRGRGGSVEGEVEGGSQEDDGECMAHSCRPYGESLLQL